MRNAVTTVSVLGLSLGLSLGLVVTSACSEKKSASEGGSSSRSSSRSSTRDPAGNAPAAAMLAWKQLGALGLEAEVPEDAMVDDTTAGAGFSSATIYASPTTFVFGPGELSPVADTLEKTKAELEKDPNKLDAWTKEEKTEDGWILEGTRTSMMGNKLYAISVRRTIGQAVRLPHQREFGSRARSRQEALPVPACREVIAAK